MIGPSSELSRENGCRKSGQLKIKRKFYENSHDVLKLAAHITEVSSFAGLFLSKCIHSCKTINFSQLFQRTIDWISESKVDCMQERFVHFVVRFLVNLLFSSSEKY